MVPSYLGSDHQMNASATRANVPSAATVRPFLPPAPTPGTPYACCVIVIGPSGTVDAAGTAAPPYPLNMPGTALAVIPASLPRNRPAIAQTSITGPAQIG